jgi:hypothetical protein
MAEMKSKNKWSAWGVLLVSLAAIALAGCATGKHLNWRMIDPGRLAADAENRKWNTYRFETVGPYSYQRIAYVLFSDDVTVDMWNLPYVNLGKMSLREVEQDHDAYLKSRMWPGTILTFHEFQRDGRVIAYTANELETEVDLWETAASGSKVDLRLVYTDRRSFSGGDNGQPNDSLER